MPVKWPFHACENVIIRYALSPLDSTLALRGTGKHGARNSGYPLKKKLRISPEAPCKRLQGDETGSNHRGTIRK
jgi:hypothetical protein